MKTNAFKRIAIQTVSPKATKEGVRNLLRKRASINILAAIVGAQIALNDLLGTMGKIRLGYAIKQEEKLAAQRDLGFLIRHLVITGKLLKVKIPPAQRKIKVVGTVLDNLLALEFPIAALTKSVIGLPTIGTDAPLTTIGPNVINSLNAAYALSWSLLGIPASEVMASHVEAIRDQFPAEIFAEPAAKPAPTKLSEEEKAKREADKLAAAPAIAAAKAEAKAKRDAEKAVRVANKLAAQVAAAKALLAANPS